MIRQASGLRGTTAAERIIPKGIPKEPVAAIKPWYFPRECAGIISAIYTIAIIFIPIIPNPVKNLHKANKA